MTGIEQAIRAAGSQAKLAKLLGCSQQNISSWLKREYCPVVHAVAIENVTGISRSLLVDPRLVEMMSSGI